MALPLVNHGAIDLGVRRPTRQRLAPPPQSGAPTTTTTTTARAIVQRPARRCCSTAALPADFELAPEHAPRGHERGIAKDGAEGGSSCAPPCDATATGGGGGERGQMHEEEREGRGVRGEEAVARKGGFGDEERDGGHQWVFLRRRRGWGRGRGRVWWVAGRDEVSGVAAGKRRVGRW